MNINYRLWFTNHTWIKSRIVTNNNNKNTIIKYDAIFCVYVDVKNDVISSWILNMNF